MTLMLSLDIETVIKRWLQDTHLKGDRLQGICTMETF
jgi:hypothetical protein